MPPQAVRDGDRPRLAESQGRAERRRRDLNPRKGCPFTTLAVSRTRPGYATSPSLPRVPGRSATGQSVPGRRPGLRLESPFAVSEACLLYTSDAADDLLCVDLGGRRIIKKKKKNYSL